VSLFLKTFFLLQECLVMWRVCVQPPVRIQSSQKQHDGVEVILVALQNNDDVVRKEELV